MSEISGPRTIPGDWHDGTIPANVAIDDTAYIESTFSFVEFRSEMVPGVTMGRGASAYFGTMFDVGSQGRVTLGEYALVHGARIICDSTIEIHDYALISWNVLLMDNYRVPRDPDVRRHLLERVPVLSDRRLDGNTEPAPIVIGRDHLDCGSVASPFRETESMKDGSDAVADWPLLNALLNTASGATWVSLHHGGGVGIGRSIHAGQVAVADGTDLAAEKLARLLSNDPGMGVIRHADAGYDRAVEVAKERGVRIPMSESR